MRKPGTNIRRAFALALLSVACAAFARGQQEARRIDETERARCDLSEVPQVTDLTRPLFVELGRHPRARAAVVVHAPRAGEGLSYALQVRRWLTEARGVAPERLLDIYGGPAPKKRLELWLVPEGAAPPRAAPPVAREGVTLFDRYTFRDGESCDSGRELSLEVFAATLKCLPDWRGTVVVRPHYNRRGAESHDADWSPPLTRRGALRRAAVDRLHLVRQLGLGHARIRAVVGAPDRWAHAELWLVPPAKAAPGGR